MRTSAGLLRGALLLVAYYVIALPAGLVARLVHDPLHRRLDPWATSYWITQPHERNSS